MPCTCVLDGVRAVGARLQRSLLVDFGDAGVDEAAPRGFVEGARVGLGGGLRGVAGELLDESEEALVVVAEEGGEGVNFFNNVLHLNSKVQIEILV